jgi:hypothetical protein
MIMHEVGQLMKYVQIEMEEQEICNIVNDVEKIYPRTIMEIGEI